MMDRAYEKGVIPYCQEHNIGFVAFSPIASGYLSGKVDPNQTFTGDDVRQWVPQLKKENMLANRPLLEVLSNMAARKHATNAQISLAWMLRKYPHVVPIPGSKNKGRILENLGAWSDGVYRRVRSALSPRRFPVRAQTCPRPGVRHRGAGGEAWSPLREHRLGQMRRGSLLRNRPGHCQPDAGMRGKAILAAGDLPTGNEKGLLHFATAPSLLSQFWALEASLPKALAQ